ncbi:MAG: hypothetical protein GY851_24235 [bacterium]|nr:hypothetical protein [bacterium]
MLSLILTVALPTLGAIGGVHGDSHGPPIMDTHRGGAIAVECGANDEDVRQLLRDVAVTPREAWASGRIDYWRNHRVDLTPIFIRLLNEKGQEEGLVDPRGGEGSEATILAWIGYLGTEKGVEYLIGLCKTSLDEGVYSQDTMYDIGFVLEGLGFSGDDRALDLLFRMQADEYWRPEGGPTVQMEAIEGAMSADEHNRYVRYKLKEYAIRAIAWSGTPRALRALASGNGVNPQFANDLEKYFDIAARTRAGILLYPELVGQKLARDKKKLLKSIYKEYGKTYKAVKVTHDNKRMRN